MQKNITVPLSDIGNARHVRNIRAAIKTDIKNGKTSLEKVLADNDIYEKYIANMKLLDLIGALPGYGKISGKKILAELKINTCKTVKGLGKNQYESFINYFKVKPGA